MRFEFSTANRVIFGEGVLQEVPLLAARQAHRVCVVTGSRPARASTLVAGLHETGLDTRLLPVAGEPTTLVAREGARFVREAGCDLVIGFGGGSVLDAAKAIGVLAAAPGDVLDYLEVIGAGKALPSGSLPVFAVPTTAGTGSEVTRNAVLASPEHQVKVSLRSPHMLPVLAVIDPELTYSLPPHLTASTGLDALTQVIEPFVSHLANPVADALGREGINRAARGLPQVFNDGTDPAARREMALASLMGGMALANAKLGAVHGFAGPIGGMFPQAPHGAVCGRLLPVVTRFNIRAMRQRSPENPALVRYAEVAGMLTGNPEAQPEAAADWLDALGDVMALPPLRSYGISTNDFEILVEKSRQASSMKGNPIALTADELAAILEAAL